MQLEAGKYYKTRDGRKVGPAMRVGGFEEKRMSLGQGFYYRAHDGKYLERPSHDHRSDIVALWDEDPVRTVTRREIVPGVYGRVCVNERGDGSGLQGITMCSTLDPKELREAIKTLTALAEALESGDA